MRSLIVAVAGPRLDFETRETWLMRAADLAGVSYRQTKALYYGEILDPACAAALKFEAAAAAKAKAGAGDLAGQLEGLVARLQQDAPFLARAEIDALHRVAGKLRGAFGA